MVCEQAQKEHIALQPFLVHNTGHVAMRQYEYEFICSRTPFCFLNISAPFNRTEKVLYSKCLYGSQFSGEKNDLKIGYLVDDILSKNPV